MPEKIGTGSDERGCGFSARDGLEDDTDFVVPESQTGTATGNPAEGITCSAATEVALRIEAASASDFAVLPAGEDLVRSFSLEIWITGLRWFGITREMFATAGCFARRRTAGGGSAFRESSFGSAGRALSEESFFEIGQSAAESFLFGIAEARSDGFPDGGVDIFGGSPFSTCGTGSRETKRVCQCWRKLCPVSSGSESAAGGIHGAPSGCDCVVCCTPRLPPLLFMPRTRADAVPNQ